MSDKIDTFYGPRGLFTYEEMFKSIKATIYPEDKYIGFPPPELGEGSVISVYRAMSVNLTDANEKQIYRTWQTSVIDLLTEKKIILGNQDTILPDKNSILFRDMNIVITRVSETDIDEFEPIKYKTVTKQTKDMEKGTQSLEQKGKNGKLKKTYHVRRENNKEVSRKLINKEVVVESVDEIILIGTGPKLAKSGPYLTEINSAAKQYDINGTALSCLMMIESGGTANTGFPDAQYNGLFQYEEGFWADISKKAGYGGSSIYNGPAQIYTTAYALTHGFATRWPPWKRCSDK
ncbi:MAG: G5 domain-containing protein [Patescibacteria group bacterium]|jgi:hypothetical protein